MEILTWVSQSGIIICMAKLPEHEPYSFSTCSTALGAQADIHKAAWTDGQHTYNTALDAMTIKISGDIVAKGNKNLSASVLYEKLCETLQAAFNPKYFGTLYYDSEAGRKFVRARASAAVTISDESARNGTFDIDLECDLPYWLDGNEERIALGNIQGGFSFPFSFPVSFGWYTQNTAVYNYSGFVIEPVIEFEQAATQIIIENKTTGEFLQIDHPVGTGEKMVIDCADKTITLTDGITCTDVSNYVTLDSDFITLTHGLNEIRISRERSTRQPRVVMRWNKPILAR